jgi:hypothetical protein
MNGQGKTSRPRRPADAPARPLPASPPATARAPAPSCGTGAKQASVTAELEITHGESPESGEPTSYVTLGLTVAANGLHRVVRRGFHHQRARRQDPRRALARPRLRPPRRGRRRHARRLPRESGEIGEVLAATLAGEVDPAELDGWLGEHREWVRAFAGRKRCSLSDPQDLAALGKAAYEERTGVNRMLKEAKAQLEGLPTVQRPTNAKGDVLGAEDLPAVSGAVAGLEARLRALHTELGAARAARPAEAVAAERAQLEADLAEAQAAQAQASEAADACLAESEQADAALTRARTDEANAVHAGEQARVALARAERALAALTGEDGACPTCGRKYTEALRAKLLGPLEDARDAARTAAEDARVRADELRAGLQPLRDAAQEWQDRLRRLSQDRQNHAAAVARLEARLDALDAEAAAAGAGRPAADIEADIAATEASLERARGAVKALEALAQRAELEAPHRGAGGRGRRAGLDGPVVQGRRAHEKRFMVRGLDAFADALQRRSWPPSGTASPWTSTASGSRLLLAGPCGGAPARRAVLATASRPWPPRPSGWPTRRAARCCCSTT